MNGESSTGQLPANGNGLHLDTDRLAPPINNINAPTAAGMANMSSSNGITGGVLTNNGSNRAQAMISGMEMLTPRLTRMSSANPLAASGQPFLLSGYLDKKARWSSKFSERYFVLTHSALHYFKRGAGVELFGEERGRIPIEQVHLPFVSYNPFDYVAYSLCLCDNNK
jgi:hypothetical protein